MSGLKVPVHMSCFLFLTLFVGMKASSTLIAWLTKFLVEIENEMRSGSDDTLAETLYTLGA